MYQLVKSFIESPNPEQHQLHSLNIIEEFSNLAHQAFEKNDPAALLTAHRILYTINLAHLATSWASPVHQINHPIISQIKYQLESSWHKTEHGKYRSLLTNLPEVNNFETWVKQQVAQHPSNELHPIFKFLKDKATLEQKREFLFQESPLEMLFGDIIAMMLPGVYGSIKVEFLKNYWDEVGHANDAKFHRSLRGDLMKRLQVPTDCYYEQLELLICEELALINTYLSLATNRAKHTELVGVILATELMIPNRFQYSIDGFQRLGLSKNEMTYLVEHTSVDEVHAEDWLHHVVMPILQDKNSNMADIVYGIFRRLDISVTVLNQLHSRLKSQSTCCIGAYTE